MVGYPITSIHQVELTSRCNLRCRYCPSPHLPREKMDMVHEHYLMALGWASHYVRRGTQREFNVAGIGESTLHPRFVEYVAMAREQLGPDVDIVLATNGLLVDRALARSLKPYRPRIWVSMHRPERAGPAVEALKAEGLLSGVSADPSIAAIDWAGQVKWHTSHAPSRCAWIDTGRVMVMADGRVTTCCLDASGSGVVCNIADDITKARLQPYALCETCSYSLDHLKVQEAAA